MTEQSSQATDLPPRVLFFDGVCVMCNGLVQHLLAVDQQRRFHFATLQGQTAEDLRGRFPAFSGSLEAPGSLDTMVYVEDGKIYTRSEGVLRAARQLGYPWRALWWFRWLPRGLTDLVYRAVARLRYRVFGKREQCMVPTAEERERFLP